MRFPLWETLQFYGVWRALQANVLYLAERNRPQTTQLYRVIRGEIDPCVLKTSLAPRSCCEEHGAEKKFYDAKFASENQDAFHDDADRVLQRLCKVGLENNVNSVVAMAVLLVRALCFLNSASAKGGAENKRSEFLLSLVRR